jgi:hypothetical protein
MGRLLEDQPDDSNPIEFTHFDSWFEDEDGETTVALEGAEDYGYDDEGIGARAMEVIESWEATLNLKLNPYPDAEDFREFGHVDGVAWLFDLVIMKLLKAGYDVFKGDSFIEVYRGGVK